MEQRDYFMRQIEGILKMLIGVTQKAFGLQTNNFVLGMSQIDQDLINQLDLSIDDIIKIKESDLLNKLKETGQENIYVLVEFLALLVKKIKEVKKEKDYNLKELINKGVVLIDFLDNETKTYSLKRVTLKKELLRHVVHLND